MEAFLSQIEGHDADYANYLRGLVGERLDVMNRKEVADFFGVAVDTLDLWKRKGCPHEGINASGEAEYSVRVVAQWVVQQKKVKLQDDDGERIEREIRAEKLRMAEIQRKKVEQSLVELDHVKTIWMSVLSDVAAQLDRNHKQLGDEAIEAWNDLVKFCRDRFVEEFEQLESAP